MAGGRQMGQGEVPSPAGASHLPALLAGRTNAAGRTAAGPRLAAEHVEEQAAYNQVGGVLPFQMEGHQRAGALHAAQQLECRETLREKLDDCRQGSREAPLACQAALGRPAADADDAGGCSVPLC